MRLGNLDGRAVVVDSSGILDLNAVSDGVLPNDPMAYVEAQWRERATAYLDSAAYEPVPTDRLGPPIPRPGKMLAVALNYQGHAVESGREVPAEPSVFAMLTSSLAGPFDAIELPPNLSMIDYEAEVVVVIGKTMRGVLADEVWDHVAGITAGQDISDRREQRRAPNQFSLAKSYDTFSPIGPTMATLDEFGDLSAIEVVGRVDGDEVQRGHVGELIYSIPDLLAWTCRYVTLEPGDLVFTGTPDGVGSRREPQLFLEPGMVIETEIAQVGTMQNPVHQSASPSRGVAHLVGGDA